MYPASVRFRLKVWLKRDGYEGWQYACTAEPRAPLLYMFTASKQKALLVDEPEMTAFRIHAQKLGHRVQIDVTAGGNDGS